jgi:citrate synthase
MSENNQKAVVRGLRNVAAAETKISYVNPSGQLYYLGYNIDDLVGNVIYAEIAYLLIHRKLPNKQELDAFSNQLFAEMHLPQAIIDSIKCTPKNCAPMDVLRTEVSHLGEFDLDGNDFSPEANL